MTLAVIICGVYNVFWGVGITTPSTYSGKGLYLPLAWRGLIRRRQAGPRHVRFYIFTNRCANRDVRCLAEAPRFGLRVDQACP